MKACIALCYFGVSASFAWANPTPSPAPALVTLNFPETDVREILPLYESLTHLKVVRDNFVQGKITVSVAEPVEPAKATEIIERTLFANGLGIIQIDPDTIELSGHGKNPRAVGIPTISDPAQLPTQERLVSYLFTFRYVDPQMIQEAFQHYLAPPQPYTSFVPVGGALWVTERTSVIRQLLIAVQKMDVPPTERSPKPAPIKR